MNLKTLLGDTVAVVSLAFRKLQEDLIIRMQLNLYTNVGPDTLTQILLECSQRIYMFTLS